MEQKTYTPPEWEAYSYQQAMAADINNYLLDDYTEEELRELLAERDSFEEELRDRLWTADSVTGNASGSYTFNRWKASQYVVDNIELLDEAASEFGMDATSVGEAVLREDWEYLDVTIRCYLLGQMLAEVLDELEEELEAGK